MPLAHSVARIAACCKFAAGRGAPFVDAASGLFAHRARQSGAAWPRIVGTAHAADGIIDLVRQARWYTPTMDLRFMDRKIDTKTGAAGATSKAGVGHGFCDKAKKPELA